MRYRCKTKEGGNFGLWLMAGGLALTLIALMPVRVLLLLLGLGLVILGALAFVGKKK